MTNSIRGNKKSFIILIFAGLITITKMPLHPPCGCHPYSVYKTVDSLLINNKQTTTTTIFKFEKSARE